MKVLAISGKAGHGKDQFAEYMQECLQYRDKSVIVLHYADLVKFYCKQYFGWDGKKSAGGRYLLQWVGTDLMRAYNENYWVDIIGEFLAALNETDEFDVALIPDARFPNEIEELDNFGLDVYAIRVVRYNEDGSVYQSLTTAGELGNHPSETSLDDYKYWDYIVENRELDELHNAAECVLIDMGIIEEDK